MGGIYYFRFKIDGGGFIILDLVGFYILFEGLLIPMFLIIGG